MSIALIPGSFDPITRGHLDVITRAARGFDRVFVAVMTNDMSRYVPGAQDKTYAFSMEERREMAELACAELPNVTVITAGGMLIDLVDRLGCDFIIKGLRNADDYAYEQKHALWNRAHNPRAETLYMPTDPALAEISSTAVRDRLARGEDASDLLPAPVAAYIGERNAQDGNTKNT